MSSRCELAYIRDDSEETFGSRRMPGFHNIVLCRDDAQEKARAARLILYESLEIPILDS